MQDGSRNSRDGAWLAFIGVAVVQLSTAVATIGFVLYVVRLGRDSQTIGDWFLVAGLVVASGFIAPVLLLGSGRWAANGVPLTESEWRSIAAIVGTLFAIGAVVIRVLSLFALQVISHAN